MRFPLFSKTHRLRDQISRSRLRFAIPPFVAVIAWAVGVGVIGIASGRPGPAPLYALLTFFLVLMILAVAGAATPFPLVAGVLSFHGRIQTVLVTAAAMTPLVFPLLLAESTLAYDLAFSGFMLLGFYLECVLVATVFYVILRAVVFLRRPDLGGGGNTE